MKRGIRQIATCMIAPGLLGPALLACSSVADTSSDRRNQAREQVTQSEAPKSSAQNVRENSCLLVTRAELEEILRAPIEEGPPEGSKCMYHSKDEVPRRSFVAIEVAWTDGRKTMDAQRVSTSAVSQPKRPSAASSAKSAAKSEAKSEDKSEAILAGVADEAFFVEAGFVTTLHARKGDVAVSVETFGVSREELTAIARRAVTRLTASSSQQPVR